MLFAGVVELSSAGANAQMTIETSSIADLINAFSGSRSKPDGGSSTKPILAKIKGTVVCAGSPLIALLSERTVVYAHHNVWREVEVLKSIQGENGVRQERWLKEDVGIEYDSVLCPFFIDEGTGQ